MKPTADLQGPISKIAEECVRVAILAVITECCPALTDKFGSTWQAALKSPLLHDLIADVATMLRQDPDDFWDFGLKITRFFFDMWSLWQTDQKMSDLQWSIYREIAIARVMIMVANRSLPFSQQTVN